jgi:hypothetical protein
LPFCCLPSSVGHFASSPPLFICPEAVLLSIIHIHIHPQILYATFPNGQSLFEEKYLTMQL